MTARRKRPVGKREQKARQSADTARRASRRRCAARLRRYTIASIIRELPEGDLASFEEAG